MSSVRFKRCDITERTDYVKVYECGRHQSMAGAGSFMKNHYSINRLLILLSSFDVEWKKGQFGLIHSVYCKKVDYEKR